MAGRSNSTFRTPTALEESVYGSPEASPFGSPEAFFELEGTSGEYGNPEEETLGISGLEGEEEFEWGESGSSQAEGFEGEDMFAPLASQQDRSYQNGEALEEQINGLLGYSEEGEGGWESQPEGEADLFFGKLLKAAKKIGKFAAPLAKKFAPMVAGSLVSMIPGGGALAPAVSKLTNSLINEAEMEVFENEDRLINLFSQQEALSEAAYPEAQDRALIHLLAAEAATAQTEAEAEAHVAATLPILFTLMGTRHSLRRVMPTLIQANIRLVRVMRPNANQLLRLTPIINGITIGALGRAARRGQPVSPPLAIKTMAAAAHRVLNNPSLVQKTIQRNAVLRARTAPINQRPAILYSPVAARRFPRVRSAMPTRV